MRRFQAALYLFVSFFLAFGIGLQFPLAALAEPSLPNPSLPNPSLPNPSLPDISLPETSLPKTSIPSTTIPNTTVPGSSGADSSRSDGPQEQDSAHPNSSDGNSLDGTDGTFHPPSDASGSKLYASLKFVLADVVNGQIKLVDDALRSGDDFKVGKSVFYNYLGKIGRSALGLFLPEDSAWKLGLDTWTGYDHGRDASKFYRAYQAHKALKEGYGLGKTLNDASKLASKLPKPLGKLTPWTAGIGIAFSGGEGIYNAYQAFQADNSSERMDYSVKAVGNVGEILMSSAALVAPAAPPVAAGLAIVGVLLWGGSMLWSHRKTIPRIVSKVKKGLTKAWSYLRGWFNK